uniref:Nuclear receptor-interacting protein 1 n=1 Tax=Anthurium amnicola TaxID=1678845 RepID=A0A1D1YJ69_9ARAE
MVLREGQTIRKPHVCLGVTGWVSETHETSGKKILHLQVKVGWCQPPGAANPGSHLDARNGGEVVDCLRGQESSLPAPAPVKRKYSYSGSFAILNQWKGGLDSPVPGAPDHLRTFQWNT